MIGRPDRLGRVMSPSSTEVAAALREFAERIGALDPATGGEGVEIRVDRHEDALTLSPAVAARIPAITT